MKKIIILILIIFIYSCNNIESKDTGLKLMNDKIKIIEIDSCEYINIGTTTYLIHKGNCKNHK